MSSLSTAVGPDASPRYRPAGKHLIFALAGEEYGLSVLDVREIVQMTDITVVPHMPPHVKGVINLRGTIVPVIDLRLALGFTGREYDARTCIVVTEVVLADGRALTGLIVDAVLEVISISESEVGPVPEPGARMAGRYLRGLAHVRGKVRILLDAAIVAGSAGREPCRWS
jgi:purine-binding chemotaxis protein CheW